MVAGLTRIGEVAQRIMDGRLVGRRSRHLRSVLQQNLVTVLEGRADGKDRVAVVGIGQTKHQATR